MSAKRRIVVVTDEMYNRRTYLHEVIDLMNECNLDDHLIRDLLKRGIADDRRFPTIGDFIESLKEVEDLEDFAFYMKHEV